MAQRNDSGIFIDVSGIVRMRHCLEDFSTILHHGMDIDRPLLGWMVSYSQHYGALCNRLSALIPDCIWSILQDWSLRRGFSRIYSGSYSPIQPLAIGQAIVKASRHRDLSVTSSLRVTSAELLAYPLEVAASQMAGF